MGAEPRKPIFRREQIIKLQRLLYMKYKPGEIADEIGVTADTVYRCYLPAGAPHERDSAGNIWIVGTAFSAWALEQVGRGKIKKHPMRDGEAWCCKCNCAVQIQKPKIKTINRYIGMVQGTCPGCGGKVNRAIAGAEAAEKSKRKKPQPVAQGEA